MAIPYRTLLRPSLRASCAMVCGGMGLALLLAAGWPHLKFIGQIVFVGVFTRALIIGRLLAWISTRTRFAWPKSAATLAAASVFATIIGAHFFSYRAELSKFSQSQDDFLAVSADPQLHEASFAEELAAQSFISYGSRFFGFEGQAKDGAAAILGPEFGVGLFLIELILAMLLGAYFPAGVASEPNCTKCRRWMVEHQLAEAAHGRRDEFIEAMVGARPKKALSHLQPPDTDEKLILSVARCPIHNTPKDDTILRIREVTLRRRDRQRRLRHLADLRLDPLEAAILTEYGATLDG